MKRILGISKRDRLKREEIRPIIHKKGKDKMSCSKKAKVDSFNKGKGQIKEKAHNSRYKENKKTRRKGLATEGYRLQASEYPVKQFYSSANVRRQIRQNCKYSFSVTDATVVANEFLSSYHCYDF